MSIVRMYCGSFIKISVSDESVPQRFIIDVLISFMVFSDHLEYQAFIHFLYNIKRLKGKKFTEYDQKLIHDLLIMKAKSLKTLEEFQGFYQFLSDLHTEHNEFQEIKNGVWVSREGVIFKLFQFVEQTIKIKIHEKQQKETDKNAEKVIQEKLKKNDPFVQLLELPPLDEVELNLTYNNCYQTNKTVETEFAKKIPGDNELCVVLVCDDDINKKEPNIFYLWYRFRDVQGEMREGRISQVELDRWMGAEKTGLNLQEPLNNRIRLRVERRDKAEVRFYFKDFLEKILNENGKKNQLILNSLSLVI